jgi:DNA-binding MarR family transcriptional regulator
MQMVHLLRTVTMELDLFVAEFAETNRLHPTDLRALIHLLDAARAGTQATPGWLAEQLGLNSASITGLLDRLERAGHVRRVRDGRDRRRVHVVVEERGIDIGWSFFGPLIDRIIATMRGYDEVELETVRRFLHGIVDVVVAQRGARTGSVAPAAPPRHAVHEPGAEQPREPHTRPHYRRLKG